MTQIDHSVIISADCHATAQREVFTDYLEPQWRDEHAAWARRREGTPHSANPHPKIDEAVNWDSELRLAGLEAEGTVAEVIFPNGLPFGFSKPLRDCMVNENWWA